MKILLALALLCATPALAAPTKSKSSLAYQYYSRGVELSARKKWTEALKQFQSAIDLNPAFVSAYVEFARTKVMAGDRKAGLEKLAAAAGVARTKEDKTRVQKERENLSEIFYTNETFQRYQDGLNLLSLDRAGNAMGPLEEAMKADPNNILVLAAYGRALRQEDRLKEAVATLEQAFTLNENKRDVRFDLAEASLGQTPARAHELLEPLLASRSDDEKSIILDAQALSKLERNGDAIESLREFLEKQPSSLYAPFWLGKLYEKETNGAWNARKYLMTFLRRTEALSAVSKDENNPDARALRALKTEAEQILDRVNRSLE